jgi:hypothetical protein
MGAEINQSGLPLLHTGNGGLRLGLRLTCIVFLFAQKLDQVDVLVLEEVRFQKTRKLVACLLSRLLALLV